MRVTIVTPTYNERENISKLVPAIFSLKISGLSVIVVDDNSPDGTADVVRELSHRYSVRVLHRAKKMGIGSAYVAGMSAAIQNGAEAIFEMDADFSHDPQDLPKMLETLNKCDVVIGSRKIAGGKIIGWGWIRQAMSSGAMWFSRKILGLKTHDVTAGFRCFRAEVLKNINIGSIQSNGYAFQEELLYRVEQKGYRVTEIPVTFVDRQLGKSKLSKKDIIEFFIRMIQLRFLK